MTAVVVAGSIPAGAARFRSLVVKCDNSGAAGSIPAVGPQGVA